MGTTKQIPRAEWKDYFERFTRDHVSRHADEAVDIEVLSPTVGDQLEARAERLVGIAYDSRSNAFQILLEDVDHLVFQPVDVWVIEEDDGFVSAIEMIRPDGTREIIHLMQTGPLAPLYDEPAPPRA
jgi:hypothetical protein